MEDGDWMSIHAELPERLAVIRAYDYFFSVVIIEKSLNMLQNHPEVVDIAIPDGIKVTTVFEETPRIILMIVQLVSLFLDGL